MTINSQGKLHEFENLVLDLKQNRSDRVTRDFAEFLSKDMVNPEPSDFVVFTVPETHSYAVLVTEVTCNTFKLLSRLEHDGYIEDVEMSIQTLFELLNQDSGLGSGDLSEIINNDKRWVMIGFSVVDEEGVLSTVKRFSRETISPSFAS